MISTRTDSVTPLLGGATLLACMIPQFLPWADHCDIPSFESLMKTVRMRAVAEDENLRLLVRVADEAVQEESIPNELAGEQEVDRPIDFLRDSVI